MSNSNDFRASQIQTNKIIATGSTDTNARILIYPIDAQNNLNPNTGEINPQAFSTSSIGEDVFLYVSGAIGGLNNNSHGASVFGGDLYVSGNLYLLGTTNISGAGGSGVTSASYLLLGNNLALPNERKFTVGAGLSENDGGAHGNYTISAPFISSSFLTVNSESLLPNERRLVFGIGLSSSDGGSNNGLTASIDNTVVATLSGSTFTGQVKFNDGVSGSIQALSNGLPYIISGPNINIVTNSLGQIEVSGTNTSTGGSGEVSASYLVLSSTSSLANERVFSVGTGLSSSDGGANGNFHVTAPFVSATFLTVNSETLLPNERSLVFGTGLSSSDGGANNGLTASIDNSVVATISGSTFTGAVKFNSGLSGSLQTLSDGNPYLSAGPRITLVTNSLGQIEISGSSFSNGTIVFDSTLPFSSGNFYNDLQEATNAANALGGGLPIYIVNDSTISSGSYDFNKLDFKGDRAGLPRLFFTNTATISGLPRLLEHVALVNQKVSGNLVTLQMDNYVHVRGMFGGLTSWSPATEHFIDLAGYDLKLYLEDYDNFIESDIVSPFVTNSNAPSKLILQSNYPDSNFLKNILTDTNTTLELYLGKNSTTSIPSFFTASFPGITPVIKNIFENNITCSISTSQNDFSTSNWDYSDNLWLYPTTDVDITGFSFTSNFTKHTKNIINFSTSSVITIKYQSTGSTATNRVITPTQSDLTLNYGKMLILKRDPQWENRWYSFVVGTDVGTTSSNTNTGAGEVSASYLVLSATSSLANERVFSVGTGLSSSDGGAGNNFHITAPFVSASYITTTIESLLPNDRVLTAGSGTNIVDNGPGSTIIFNAPENFSYKTIVTNSIVRIPQNQQMIYDGTITVDGDLIIDGELVQNNDSLISFGLQITGSNIVYTTASQIPSASQFLKSVSSTHAEFQSFYTFRTTISSSNQTLINGSFYKFNTSGGAITNISLSNPVTSLGAYMKLMKTSTDSNTITIVSPSGGNINATLGTSGLSVGASGRQGFALDCDGTDWWLTPFVAF